MTTDLPETVELEGLRLSRLADTDADDLLKHFSDPQVTEFLDFTPLSTREEAEEIVRWADGLFDERRGIRWAIRVHGSGAFVGTCGFNSVVLKHAARGEIAFDLEQRYWGLGVMRTILPFLVHHGFQELGLHRLQAFVTPGNDRSAHLLARYGFRHEGRLRGYGQWREAYWDQDLYARLADD